LVLGWMAAAPAYAQDSVSTGPDSLPRISLDAQTGLTEGNLGWIRLTPVAPFTVAGGEAAGEPLHFEPDAETGLRALVGVPVETGDSFSVTLFLQAGDRRDTLVASLPVRRSGYPSEVLRVAPGFVKPDSAAAARIQSEILKSREVSRRSQRRTRLWAGPFRLPRSTRITSPFGTARIFNGEVQSRHLGTDFAGAVGEPVLAAGRGIVVLVANFYLAGGTIYLDHGAGLITAYFHLSRAYVRQGQIVRAGQRIGAVGRSGRVTGPHLHWVARYGTISVDPMSLLQLVPPLP
jgi:murein DD-endopeptidase MepM/ murein hydrolase activator NlpD